MPATYTFPGIYIEEVPSGIRTIAGVSTTDTGFIDFFQRGPVNEPIRITSFGDFERIFGGLDRRSAASYASGAGAILRATEQEDRNIRLGEDCALRIQSLMCPRRR
jgi:phage tail sheath protein FI